MKMTPMRWTYVIVYVVGIFVVLMDLFVWRPN